jgi:lipopolysaccharide transport system ATP-binding protein
MGLGVAPERLLSEDLERIDREGTILHAVRVRGDGGVVTDHLDIRRPVVLEMEYSTTVPDLVLTLYFQLRNPDGIWLFSTTDLDPEWRGRPRAVGRYISQAVIPGNFLAEGTLLVTVGCDRASGGREFRVRDAVGFHVIDSTSARGNNPGRVTGVIRPLLTWTTRPAVVGSEIATRDAD